MKTMKKGSLVLIRNTRKLQRRDLRQGFCQPPNVPHTFHWENALNDMLSASGARSSATLAEGIFMLPAKALPLGAGLSAFAPDRFLLPHPRNFGSGDGHFISSLVLTGPDPGFLPSSPRWACSSGRFALRRPRLWHCHPTWLLISVFSLPGA